MGFSDFQSWKGLFWIMCTYSLPVMTGWPAHLAHPSSSPSVLCQHRCRRVCYLTDRMAESFNVRCNSLTSADRITFTPWGNEIMPPDYDDSDQHKKSYSFSVSYMTLYKPKINFHTPTKNPRYWLRKHKHSVQAPQGRNVTAVAFLPDLFTVMKKPQTQCFASLSLGFS